MARIRQVTRIKAFDTGFEQDSGNESENPPPPPPPSNKNKNKKKKGNKTTERAGLVISVTRVRRYMKNGNYAPRVAGLSAVYMSAVLEYCVAEVLEIAGTVVKDNFRKTILPRHILLAIKNDEELEQLLHNVTIPYCGTNVPRPIHPRLLNKNDKNYNKNAKAV